MLQVHVRPQEAAQLGWWLQQGWQECGTAPQQNLVAVAVDYWVWYWSKKVSE
jgi:hypothetical protein